MTAGEPVALQGWGWRFHDGRREERALRNYAIGHAAIVAFIAVWIAGATRLLSWSWPLLPTVGVGAVALVLGVFGGYVYARWTIARCRDGPRHGTVAHPVERAFPWVVVLGALTAALASADTPVGFMPLGLLEGYAILAAGAIVGHVAFETRAHTAIWVMETRALGPFRLARGLYYTRPIAQDA